MEREIYYLRELEDMYEEMIDESTPMITIWGMNYDASRVLKECDPIAYRCGFNDWLDAEVSDGNIDYNDERDEYYKVYDYQAVTYSRTY